MNFSAEIADLKRKFDVLVEAVAPIVAKYQMEAEAEERERAEARAVRAAITQGPDGRFRNAAGQVVGPSNEVIAAAQQAEADRVKAEEDAEEAYRTEGLTELEISMGIWRGPDGLYRRKNGSRYARDSQEKDPRITHPATPGPTGRDAGWPEDTSSNVMHTED